MGILTRSEIINEMNKGRIVIDPFIMGNLGPNSYDLSITDELEVYEFQNLDLKQKNPTKKITIPETGLLLEKGEFYLARTKEYTITHGFVPIIKGRSSSGRNGINVAMNSGFGDLGFSGYWTIPLQINKNITIYPFAKLLQVYYSTVDGEISTTYNGKYQNNKGLETSKLYEEYGVKTQ